MENATSEISTTLEGDLAAQRLIHAIDAIVILVGPNGHIADCNGTCETLSGFASAELLGQEVARTLAASDEASLVKNQISRIASGEEAVRFDSFLVTKSGTRRRVRWNGVRLSSGQDQSPVLLTAIDVTNEYEAIARATSLAEEKSELQGNLTRICAKYDIDPEAGAERRCERRFEFRRQQRIAPIKNDRMPSEGAFFNVECRDIGAKGIGFFLDVPPSSPTYVVELGTAPGAIYLTASVQHATVDASNGRFVIGCNYTGRLSIAGKE